MPKTLSKALLSKLLRSSAFALQMEDFHYLSGMECLLLDSIGNERLKFPRHQSSPLRELGLTDVEMNAQLSRHRQMQLAGVFEENLPWIELIQPLKIDQEVIGYWVLSACRDDRSHAESAKDFWISLAKAGVNIRWREWLNTWEKLPVFGLHQREAWLRMLGVHIQKALHDLDKVRGKLPQTDELPAMILETCTQVQARYMEALHLKDLAKRQRVCPEHLSRVFHKTTGLKFSVYLAETRVNAACDALTTSLDPISEIAGRCGFSTLSRFNHCFKIHTGMTPRAWRKRGKTIER